MQKKHEIRPYKKWSKFDRGIKAYWAAVCKNENTNY